VCGDGDQSPSEECDDSNFDNDDGCVEVGNNCVLATCGDGFVQTGVEQCDDGGTQDGDGCSAICESEIGCSQELVAGDAAIIGFNFDNPDDFAVVFLKTVGAGTPIEFTDNGWFGDDSGFRSGEGYSSYTTSAKTTAGTVVYPAIGGMQFSGSGDQILAFQGNQASPSFVYAVQSEGVSWNTDATSSNTSALPLGLVDQGTAVAVPEIDNAIYVGVTAGTQLELLAAISDSANWTGSSTVRQTMPPGPFTVTDAVDCAE
jgi:cysteine-rich repeat protein